MYSQLKIVYGIQQKARSETNNGRNWIKSINYSPAMPYQGIAIIFMVKLFISIMHNLHYNTHYKYCRTILAIFSA